MGKRGFRGTLSWQAAGTSAVRGTDPEALSLEPVTADDRTVGYVPILGPLYGGRLPAHGRLDLRLSRFFDVPRDRLDRCG